jgi:signal peptidase I
MSSPATIPDGSAQTGESPAKPLDAAQQGPRHGPHQEPLHGWAHLRLHLPTFPEALASLLRTTVMALFVLTFVLQPLVIPSESMERTLLVGDFLLFNKQVFAPPGRLTRWLMPYRPVERGDIVVFHHPNPPLLVKRVVGVPGDRLRIADGKVLVNGVPLDEPYAAFEPAPPSQFRDNFPAKVYTDPQVDPEWWRRMQSLTRNGELVVPAGEYFVMGDNRNHSSDSRYWGLVPRQAIISKPLVIYFSVRRPSTTDVESAVNDKLGNDRDFPAWLKGFARWSRIFHVVH